MVLTLFDLVLTLGGGLFMGVMRIPAQISVMLVGVAVAWFSARYAFLEGNWYILFLTIFQWPIETLIGWGMGQGLATAARWEGTSLWTYLAGLCFALWLHFLFFPPIMRPLICGFLAFIDVSRPVCE